MPATIKLDILLVETYSPYALSIADFSTYPTGYVPVSPTLQVKVAGWPITTVDFTPKSINIFNAEDLNIPTFGGDSVPLPDGIYYIKYTINPALQYFVEKTFLRTYQLQQKFDSAFMKTDMMECDNAIKKQQKIELDSIYYLIQGAIAAANNCAETEATKLYQQADKMLTNFITNKCNCNGQSQMF